MLLELLREVDVLLGQTTHVSCPSSGWYVPRTQSSHVSEMTLKNVPAGQATAPQRQDSHYHCNVTGRGYETSRIDEQIQ